MKEQHNLSPACAVVALVLLMAMAVIKRDVAMLRNLVH